jgi:hypothetical protein
MTTIGYFWSRQSRRVICDEDVSFYYVYKCQIGVIVAFAFEINLSCLFFTYIPCILILSKCFYSPTDAQVNCLKNNFKIYIKIEIKTAATCFGAVTPSSGSALLVLAKVTVVKIAN